MTEEYGIIYCAFDTSNGMSYIGQTTQDFELRKRQHFRKDSYSRKFKNALRKRKDSFVWSILTTCYSLEEINSAEVHWMKFFDSISNGYNLREGGKSGGKMSDESRKLMSIAKTGNKYCVGVIQTEEHKRLISDKMKVSYSKKFHTRESREKCRIAVIKSNTGRKHSEETKRKMAESQRLRRKREGCKQ